MQLRFLPVERQLPRREVAALERGKGVTYTVEQVARALANHYIKQHGGADGDTLIEGQPNWKAFTEAAQELIETLGLPTEGTMQ
jgi:hypothetical protein